MLVIGRPALVWVPEEAPNLAGRQEASGFSDAGREVGSVHLIPASAVSCVLGSVVSALADALERQTVAVLGRVTADRAIPRRVVPCDPNSQVVGGDPAGATT